MYMCWALREPDTETPFWLEMEDEKENEKECADGIFLVLGCCAGCFVFFFGGLDGGNGLSILSRFHVMT